jgi:hypothetical protein
MISRLTLANLAKERYFIYGCLSLACRKAVLNPACTFTALIDGENKNHLSLSSFSLKADGHSKDGGSMEFAFSLR